MRFTEQLAKEGWTRMTYVFAAFFFILAIVVTAIAVHGNSTSQLSIACYAVWLFASASVVSVLLDSRRKNR